MISICICLGIPLSIIYFQKKLYKINKKTPKGNAYRYIPLSGIIIAATYFLIPKQVRLLIIPLLNVLACIGFGILFQHHGVLYAFRYRLIKKYRDK
jgi:hypothetical protein